MPISPRRLYALGFSSCLMLLIISLFLQFGLNLEPCPLCILDRVTILILTSLYLAAYLHYRQLGIYNSFIFFTTLGGLFIAIRHVWLQQLPPDQVPACGPGLNYLLETFPVMEVIKLILNGSGECAKVDWTLLGLSTAQWTVLVFSGLLLLIISLMVLCHGKKKGSP
jgi:disulfide bond formation protein DsbB